MHLKRKKLSVVFLLVSHEDNETICRLLLLQHETESILLVWASSADALAFLNSSADVPAFSSSSSLSSSELLLVRSFYLGSMSVYHVNFTFGLFLFS